MSSEELPKWERIFGFLNDRRGLNMMESEASEDPNVDPAQELARMYAQENLDKRILEWETGLLGGEEALPAPQWVGTRREAARENSNQLGHVASSER
jgi:hypothetical protein